MTSIEFFPITIDYETTKAGKAQIQIFGKTTDNKRICVIDESFKTLEIETKLGEKTIPKENTTFVFTIPDKTKVQVVGKILLGRPEDRIKKKLPRW